MSLLVVLLLVGCDEEMAEPGGAASDRATVETAGEVTGEADTLFAAYDRPFLKPPAYDSSDVRQWVDSLMQTLSREQKIGQLFMIQPPDARGARVSAGMREAVQEHDVGGFLMPRLLPPADMASVTRELQDLAEVPLFFAADYERGVGRFTNNMTELPANMAVGATREPAFAAATGRLTAIESRAIGINLLFAPVVDVNNNPDNPIINIRSYGGDAELVGEMASAFVPAAQDYDVLTTLKHFPGHGDVDVDTHAELGAVTGDRATLDSVELRPYRMLFEQTDPAALMSAHLWVQAVDEEAVPATFSENVLTELLRDDLGFGGFVVTDDVKMGALQNDYGLAARVVRPLQAGADLILTPENLSAAIQAVERALDEGDLSQEALDRKVRRLLHAKARAGLHRERHASQEALDYLLEEPRGDHVAEAIADRALTLLKTDDVLPLQSDHQVALVQLTNYRGSESIGAAMGRLAERLGSDRLAVDVRFDREPSASEREDVLARVAEADVVIMPLYLRLVAGRGEAGLFAQQRQLAEALVEQDVPIVLVPFGNPYAVTTFREADVHLVAYDQTFASVDAAVNILDGELDPSGRLPIRVDPYEYGDGLSGIE